jgi:hypothetical protein
VAEAPTADGVMGLADRYVEAWQRAADACMSEDWRSLATKSGESRAALKTAVRNLCDRLAEVERENERLRAEMAGTDPPPDDVR